jgi:hypothetical protein
VDPLFDDYGKVVDLLLGRVTNSVEAADIDNRCYETPKASKGMPVRILSRAPDRHKTLGIRPGGPSFFGTTRKIVALRR